MDAEGQGRIGGGLHRWPDAQGEAGPAAGICDGDCAGAAAVGQRLVLL